MNFSDREIPKFCRDCVHCQRYQEISDWMPSWLPWKYECEVANPGPPKVWSHEKGDYICEKKEIKK